MNFPTPRVKPRLISTATQIGQTFRDDRLFGLEIGAAVAEPLQRQPVQLAIFTLVQIAVAPRLLARAPESLEF